jgi:hypothetical protein
MKSYAVQTNDYIEMAFKLGGFQQNYNACGLVMADGTSYGAGNQIVFYVRMNAGAIINSAFTNYNTEGAYGFSDSVLQYLGHGLIFMRLKFEGSNHFRSYISVDGISWVNTIAQQTYAMTPTYIGFFVSPYGGANPFLVSINYFKQSA